MPTFLLRLGIALLLGTVMGLERQWHHRMAGTRTNALVAIAAAVFTMLGLSMSGQESASRVIGQIVSGVGFLGAGVIFKEGGSIHGLNTAATVWCSAAVGSLAGMGFLANAAIVAGAVVFTNVVFRPLARRLRPGSEMGGTVYCLEFTCNTNQQGQVRAALLRALDGQQATLTEMNTEDLEGENRVRVRATLHAFGRNDEGVERLASSLASQPTVHEVAWKLDTSVDE
jgi:putative Mg2+ transporter-C (MgtC) family protein